MFLSNRMIEFDFQAVESLESESGFGLSREFSASGIENYMSMQMTDFGSQGFGEVGLNGEFSSSSQAFESPEVSFGSSIAESVVEFGFGSTFGAMSFSSEASSFTFAANEFSSVANGGAGSAVIESDVSFGDSMNGDSMNRLVVGISGISNGFSMPGFEYSNESVASTMVLESGAAMQFAESLDVSSSSLGPRLGAFSIESQASGMSFESPAVAMTESVQSTHFEFNLGTAVVSGTSTEATAELNGMSFFESNSMMNISLEFSGSTLLPTNGLGGIQSLTNRSSEINLSFGSGGLQFGLESTETNSTSFGGRFGRLFSSLSSQSNDVSLALG